MVCAKVFQSETQDLDSRKHLFFLFIGFAYTITFSAFFAVQGFFSFLLLIISNFTISNVGSS